LRLGKKLLIGIGLLLVVAGFGFWRRPVSFFNESMYVRDCLFGVQNRDVSVGGHRLHYEVEGPANGRAVVLVHGLGGRAEDWRDLAPYVAKAGFRVYLPDLIGYGRSEKPADFSYSVHDEADVVVGFLDALELKQVDLGGWSMGGAIVQHVAADHPDRVRRLLLFDSAGLYAGISESIGSARCFADAPSAEDSRLRCAGYFARIESQGMDHSSRAGHHADRPGCNRQDCASTENAGPDFVGRRRQDHACRSGRDASPHASTIRVRCYSGLWAPRSRPVRGTNGSQGSGICEAVTPGIRLVMPHERALSLRSGLVRKTSHSPSGRFPLAR